MEITKIKKRNGSIVDFDRTRIEHAIEKACVATGVTVASEFYSSVTDDVTELIEGKFDERIPGVEDIQDVVEMMLAERGLFEVAKAYILYRKEREAVRRHKQDELLEKIDRRNAAVSGPPDTINRCAAPPCDRKGASPVARRAERALQPLTGVRGRWVAELPELSYLRVRSADGEGDEVYSLIHDVAHTSVAFMFGEDERRLPADDTLTVVRGHFGSYPNFFFEAPVAELDAFASALLAVASEVDLERFVGRYGVRRTDPRFWEMADFLGEDLRRANPREAGVYDLGRYVDP